MYTHHPLSLLTLFMSLCFHSYVYEDIVSGSQCSSDCETEI